MSQSRAPEAVPELVQALVVRARHLPVAPEELARAVIIDLLTTSAEDFGRAADRVVQKNKELYR